VKSTQELQSLTNSPAWKLCHRLCLAALVFAGALMTAPPGNAQGYPFSQRGSVSQMVAFTDIRISYGRPVAHGRELFGNLVPWDSIWHPGADSATRVTFSRDVLVEGQKLKAGEYSLWLIPRSTAPWTLIVSRKAHAFHKPYPGSAHDALRVDVHAESGTHMESLAYYFPEVLKDSTILRIHWGTTIVPVHIKAPYRPGDKLVR
jgi:hypothetical protein